MPTARRLRSKPLRLLDSLPENLLRREPGHYFPRLVCHLCLLRFRPGLEHSGTKHLQFLAANPAPANLRSCRWLSHDRVNYHKRRRDGKTDLGPQTSDLRILTRRESEGGSGGENRTRITQVHADSLRGVDPLRSEVWLSHFFCAAGFRFRLRISRCRLFGWTPSRPAVST